MSDLGTTAEQDRWFVVGHVVNKVVQANSLLIPPAFTAVMLARRRFSFPRLVRMSAIGTYGFGVPIGFALGYGRLWNADNTAIQDRAFRLRNSASQVHADRFATAGAVAGGIAMAMVPGAGPTLVRLVGGTALGTAAGILGHLAVVEREDGLNKMIAEVKSSLPVKEATKAAENTGAPKHP